MDTVVDIASQYALPAVAATVGAMYLDAKHHIVKDIRSYRQQGQLQKAIAASGEQMGDYWTLYHASEFNDPKADALWFEGRTWTFGDVRREADRLAQWFLDQGIRPKDFVAVYMTNSAEAYFTEFALSKLGVTNAMINSSLKDATLIHCIKISGAKLVMCSPDIAPNVATVLPSLPGDIRAVAYEYGSFPNTPAPPPISLLHHADLPSLNPSFTPPKIGPNDIANLIYTSGTTGNPKACAILQGFLGLICGTGHGARATCPRTLSCMPLFHGTCFFTGLSMSVGSGGCFIILRKFSARTFFRDCYVSKATKILYVGELCRYLLATPPGEYDQKHQVRVASGNGMRAEVWDKFKIRFNIPVIQEYYRSTEGIAGFDNQQWGHGVWGSGRVGHRGLIGRWLEDTSIIVKYDPNTEMPWRNPKTGFCEKVRIGEPGEVLGRVRDLNQLTRYLNNDAATEAKLIKDVFKKGDMFQRSGDLLAYDEDGWIHFVDRVGDTYRWKGENVAAGEVRDHVAALDGVIDATVYGLRLTAYDGQAGCAAIFLEKNVDPDQFMAQLWKKLRKGGVPKYAIPRLVRLEDHQIEMNASMKHNKTVFKQKGFDPVKQDRHVKLYWLDGETFKPLTESDWAQIEKGVARL